MPYVTSNGKELSTIQIFPGSSCSAIFTYDNGTTFTCYANAGNSSNGSSTDGGAGGTTSVTFIPDFGTILCQNGCDGGNGGSSYGSSNGYTSSGSGSNRNETDFQGIPPNGYVSLGTFSSTNQGTGIQTIPAGYGSGGGGTPAYYSIDGINQATTCITGKSGICVLYMS